MRSPEAATAGGTGNGLSVSLLERFIHRNQAEAGELISRGSAPATGDRISFPPWDLPRGGCMAIQGSIRLHPWGWIPQ